jgi:hypothetical protein
MESSSERAKLLSRRLSWGVLALGAVLVLFLVFDAGFVLGSRRALEMHGPRMIGMRGTMPGPNFGFGGWGVAMPHGFIPEGHGAVGTIESISLPTITISTRDGDDTETVLLTPQTKVQGATTSISQDQLQIGQEVVALGEPGTTTANQLTAVLIRILPPSEAR